MQLLDGQMVLSPGDLTGFIACEHLTQLEQKAASGEIEKAQRDDPELEILFARGREHEEAHLDRLHGRGLEVVEIQLESSTVAGLEKAAAETLDAMRAAQAIRTAE